MVGKVGKEGRYKNLSRGGRECVTVSSPYRWGWSSHRFRGACPEERSDEGLGDASYGPDPSASLLIGDDMMGILRGYFLWRKRCLNGLNGSYGNHGLIPKVRSNAIRTMSAANGNATQSGAVPLTQISHLGSTFALFCTMSSRSSEVPSLVS